MNQQSLGPGVTQQRTVCPKRGQRSSGLRGKRQITAALRRASQLANAHGFQSFRAADLGGGPRAGTLVLVTDCQCAVVDRHGTDQRVVENPYDAHAILCAVCSICSVQLSIPDTSHARECTKKSQFCSTPQIFFFRGATPPEPPILQNGARSARW